MSLKDLVRSYPALQEFGMLARAIQPIMTDPEESRDAKRKALCGLVDELSDNTFGNSVVVKQIMKIINMGEEVCKEYGDAEAQVEGILGWCPRMRRHKEILKKEIENRRKRYNLKV